MMLQFYDRHEAGQMLASKLAVYDGKAVIIYALPRGGVIPGAVIAEQIHAPLDLTIARKIGHPMNQEYAICAVTEKGEVIYNNREAEAIDSTWLDQAIQKERDEAKRRRQRYLANRSPKVASGKIAIIVDDGVATGLTIRAAIDEVRKRHPEKIVLAVPVIPADTALELQPLVDDIVALQSPSVFLGSIGEYYENFEQVEDDEVVALLTRFD